MNAKHAPQTSLPWKQSGRYVVNTAGDSVALAEGDASYVAHAANAYPELVSALQEARECLEGNQPYTVGLGLYFARLLRQLGEAE